MKMKNYFIDQLISSSLPSKAGEGDNCDEMLIDDQMMRMYDDV